jgi:oligopeptidase B
MNRLLSIVTVILMITTSCEITEKSKKIDAPIAKKQAEELIAHGDVRIDNYFWMRLSDEQKNADIPDQQTQEVVAYLEAENQYAKEVMKHTEELQNTLYEEIIGRI